MVPLIALLFGLSQSGEGCPDDGSNRQLFSGIRCPKLALGRILAACLLGVLAAPLLTARQIIIQNFDERVVINRDGTIVVTETIQAQFIGSNWHGIYRTIPVEYTTPQGLDFTLLLQPIGVTDDSGHSLKSEQSRQGRETKFKIYVPNPDNATRTVVLRYRVLNALTFFDDHDELYWNVTGNEWEAPLEHATASIELPAGVTGLHAVAYSGAFGSHAHDAEVQSKSNVVEFSTTHSLGLHEGLTTVVGWDKGFVHEATTGQKILFILLSNWPILIPFGVFILMFYWWWTGGREPDRGSIMVQYEPPDNLTPAECGTLVDNEVTMRDISATLVDLAVKGYLTIAHQDNNTQLGLTSDYVFHLKKPPGEWDNLKPHEQQMLRGIFVPESAALALLSRLQEVSKNLPLPLSSALFAQTQATAQAAQNPAISQAIAKEYSDTYQSVAEAGKVSLPEVALSDLQNRFSLHLPFIQNYVFDTLKKHGYYLRRPDTLRLAFVAFGILIGILMLPVGFLLAATTGTAPMPWIVAAILTAIIIAGSGWFMNARTITGSRTLAKVLGFEDFLGRVEKDHIERLERTPELFEKYLPYAMALRVEKKWVQAFSGIGVQSPQWYQGAHGSSFQPSFLVNDLGVMSSQAADVMSSAPRSSGGSSSDSSSSGGTSGSGFSDSGSSGGGFGGGGGGGF